MQTSENYQRIYGNYWRTIDALIAKLILSHIKEGDSVLEAGFASGHYLAYLSDAGVKVSGIEIRKDAFEKTKDSFKRDYSQIELLHGDVLDLNNSYSLIYSTGVIQCLPEKERSRFLHHISEMSDKVVYTVPRLEEMRNLGSKEAVAVAGCIEYQTGTIAYELSRVYGYVETGIWEKQDTGIEDDFQWFYCDYSRNLSQR